AYVRRTGRSKAAGERPPPSRSLPGPAPPRRSVWGSPGQSCINGACQSCACMNGMQDCYETDLDCGGPVCAPCESGKRCLVKSSCVSGMCLIMGDIGICQ